VSASAFRRLFEALSARYGPQGWWPLASRAGRPGYDERGYHPGTYGVPGPRDRFEVAVGAVLTQNTAWLNAEAALRALRSTGLLRPAALLACHPHRLAALIRPSGYYNQKARKLRALAAYLAGLSGARVPSREALLALWGIGPETADSILLYAWHVLVPVVDAYTRRLFCRLGWSGERASYGELAALCVRGLPVDVPAYQEFHALVVRHAKEHCRVWPVCRGCPLAGRPCRWPHNSRGVALRDLGGKQRQGRAQAASARKGHLERRLARP
jgi:endonuclease-3 related protein